MAKPNQKSKNSSLWVFMVGGGVTRMRAKTFLFDVFWLCTWASAIFFFSFYSFPKVLMSRLSAYVAEQYFWAKLWTTLGMGNFFNVDFLDKDGYEVSMSAADALTSITSNPKYYWAIFMAYVVFILSVVAAGLIIYVVAQIYLVNGRKATEDEHIRGQKLVSPDVLIDLIKNPRTVLIKDSHLVQALPHWMKNLIPGFISGIEVIAMRLNELSPLTIAGIPIPMSKLCRNWCALGGQGSGKSQFLFALLMQLRAWGKKMVIYDRTGEMIEILYRPGKDFILNPADARCAAWRLLSELIFITDAATIAHYFIPDEKDSPNKIFINATRNVFADIIRVVLMRKGSASDIKLIATTYNTQQMHNLFKAYDLDSQNTIDPTNERFSANVIATLNSQPSIQFFSFFDSQKDSSTFSIRDFVRREDDACLFLASNTGFEKAIIPFMNAWIEIAVNELMMMPPTRNFRMAFIFDELSSLGKIDSFEKNLTQMRKYGGATFACLQGVSQSIEINGREMTNVYLANFQNKVVCRTEEESSAKQLSDCLLAADIRERTDSLSYGEDRQSGGVGDKRGDLNVVHWSEIGLLDDNEAFVKIAGNYPVTKVSQEPRDWPKTQPAFIERDGLRLVECSIEQCQYFADRLEELNAESNPKPKPKPDDGKKVGQRSEQKQPRLAKPQVEATHPEKPKAPSKPKNFTLPPPPEPPQTLSQDPVVGNDLFL